MMINERSLTIALPVEDSRGALVGSRRRRRSSCPCRRTRTGSTAAQPASCSSLHPGREKVKMERKRKVEGMKKGKKRTVERGREKGYFLKDFYVMLGLGVD